MSMRYKSVFPVFSFDECAKREVRSTLAERDDVQVNRSTGMWNVLIMRLSLNPSDRKIHPILLQVSEIRFVYGYANYIKARHIS